MHILKNENTTQLFYILSELIIYIQFIYSIRGVLFKNFVKQTSL